jgi:hypothetical protein
MLDSGFDRVFFVKITARLVRLYRSCPHFTAFSRIYGFFSLLFFLTSTSFQMKTPPATAISYSVLPGPYAGFLCIAGTTPGFFYIASTMLGFFSYSVLPVLSWVSLDFSVLPGLCRVSFGFSH